MKNLPSKTKKHEDSHRDTSEHGPITLDELCQRVDMLEGWVEELRKPIQEPKDNCYPNFSKESQKEIHKSIGCGPKPEDKEWDTEGKNCAPHLCEEGCDDKCHIRTVGGNGIAGLKEAFGV